MRVEEKRRILGSRRKIILWFYCYIGIEICIGILFLQLLLTLFFFCDCENWKLFLFCNRKKAAIKKRNSKSTHIIISHYQQNTNNNNKSKMLNCLLNQIMHQTIALSNNFHSQKNNFLCLEPWEVFPFKKFQVSLRRFPCQSFAFVFMSHWNAMRKFNWRHTRIVEFFFILSFLPLRSLLQILVKHRIEVVEMML